MSKIDASKFDIKNYISCVPTRESARISSGSLYPTLERLTDLAYIEPGNTEPAGKSGHPRMHYAITHHGRIRLIEELTRMKHAVAIGQFAGLFELEVSSDRS